jgi:hypothetical protein
MTRVFEESPNDDSGQMNIVGASPRRSELVRQGAPERVRRCVNGIVD